MNFFIGKISTGYKLNTIKLSITVEPHVSALRLSTFSRIHTKRVSSALLLIILIIINVSRLPNNRTISMSPASSDIWGSTVFQTLEIVEHLTIFIY